MKIHRSVLSEATFLAVEEEQQHRARDQVWRTSALTWSAGLLEGIDGECLSTEVTGGVRDLILGDVAGLLPEYDSIEIRHYLWMRNGGIAWHNDGGRVFGATIYLNREWHVNWGGIFLYLPRDEAIDRDLRAVFPSCNTMVVNDLGEYHSVTPVTAKQVRRTLQIWCTKEE